MPRVEYSTADFYRAQDIWRQMPDDLHRLTYVLYVIPWRPAGMPIWKRQAKALGISKSEYYRQKDSLHLYTEERW